MLIVYGPTGVGKTDFVNQLTQQVPAEIINMDMGQFYTPLTIGTAKPDWRNAPVPHHLFDIIGEPKNFTVTEYRDLVTKTLKDIWHNKALPILVGGSGFYLKSLFFPPQAETVPQREYPEGVDLWKELFDIDPQRAAQIDKHDTYRIKRALDIWYATGKKPSSYQPQYNPIAPAMLICLTRERDELYARINARVVQMMDEGWLDEVAQLQSSGWESFIKRKKIIGYHELLDYLAGEKTEKSLKQTIQTIQTKTRNYAKRQLTFWKMLQKELNQAPTDIGVTLETVNLTSTDLHLYIKQLQDKLSKTYHEF